MQDRPLTRHVDELITEVRRQLADAPNEHLEFYLEGLAKLVAIREWAKISDDYNVASSEEFNLARKSS